MMANPRADLPLRMFVYVHIANHPKSHEENQVPYKEAETEPDLSNIHQNSEKMQNLPRWT